VIRPVAAAVLALLLLQLTSCAGETGAVSTGYWGAPVYSYGLDHFYGPPVIYGAWGPGYFVGPPRWGGPPPRFSPRAGPRPVFHPAAPGRSMPSIPSHPRGSGMRGAATPP
jgi:hypothetical protein